MNSIGPGVIAVIGGILTLAMLAVAVSKNAQTSAVFTGAGTALSTVIAAAVAPVSGSATNTFGTTTATGGVTT
jgi:hypothetical protein